MFLVSLKCWKAALESTLNYFFGVAFWENKMQLKFIINNNAEAAIRGVLKKAVVEILQYSQENRSVGRNRHSLKSIQKTENQKVKICLTLFF